jgi:hypothetical protein
MERPTGVTILALLAFVSGGLHFLGAFLAFGSGSWLSAEARSGYFAPQAAPFVDAFGNLGFSIGMAGMIAAALTLVAAGGLWVLSRFGYRLAAIMLVINLVLDIFQLLDGYASLLTGIGALLAVVALVYLWRPDVRHAFAGFPVDAPVAH